MNRARVLALAGLMAFGLGACASENKGGATEAAKPAPATTAPAPAKTEAAKPTPAATPSNEEEEAPTRASLKVRFGIQPLYDYEGEGVQVDQVSPDTSAEEGGVKPGDILKTWNGKKITDIYKWMEYMATAKPGDVVDVGVERDKKMVPLKVKLKPAE